MALRYLILLINLLLLCSQLAAVAAFKPLIRLPRSRRGDRANISISVDDFGAKGDGRHDDTKAFIDAWRFACSWRSGAVLEVPAGNVYFVRPINFTSHCRSKITLLVRGTIIAPSDPHVWNGLNSRRWLYFDRLNNLEVKGGGTINGMGQKWWAQSCKRNATNPCRHAPTAITFHRSKHLIVQDLTLLNSQQMHMVIGNCFQVKVSRLKLIAPASSPNTDGIHITASTSILVEDSLIRTGDDCISIVTNSSDITIKNLICGPGHGISIGSLGKSGAWDQVHKVLVDGALITDTENGVRIKTWQGGSGYARNIVFSNILMKNVSNPIIIDQYYCDSFTPCGNQTSAVKVDGISYRGIKGTSATEEVMKFDCSDIFPCENIFVEDILLLLESGGEPTSYCWKASGFVSGLVYPPSCLSSADSFIASNTGLLVAAM